MTYVGGSGGVLPSMTGCPGLFGFMGDGNPNMWMLLAVAVGNNTA